MPVLHLTNRTIDAIKLPTTGRLIIYDTKLKGLGLRVMPSGAKSWFIEYRPHGGGRTNYAKRLTLGSTMELTPTEARDLAKARLGDVAYGGDPAADREKHRNQLKLRELIDRWEEKRPLGKHGRPMRPRTREFTRARLRHHVIPLLGAKAVSEITVDDVERVITAVSEGKTAKTVKGKKHNHIRVTGGPGAARKAVADLSMILSFAVREQLIPGNVAFLARKPAAGKRMDYLTTAEVAKIGAALTEMEAEGTNPRGIDILRVIILTGCRPAEIEGLKWDEIDFERCGLLLADSKTGPSFRPISSSALAILSRQSRIEDSRYVFPATRGDGHFTSSQLTWAKAREKAGLPKRVRYHARHGFATLSLAAGNSAVTVAALLGHANPRTTLTVYAHVVDELARKAADQTGRALAAALEGKRAAEVVKLKPPARRRAKG
jgi:integrase